MVKTPRDLFTKELIVGSNGPASSNSILPTVFNRLLRTKFRIVEGDKGGPDVLLAMQRGEVGGLCASLGQFRGAEQAFRDGTFRVLFRAEETPIPSIPDVASIFDIAKDEDQRRLEAWRLSDLMPLF
jgi:hypothetical protein